MPGGGPACHGCAAPLPPGASACSSCGAPRAQELGPGVVAFEHAPEFTTLPGSAPKADAVAVEAATPLPRPAASQGQPSPGGPRVRFATLPAGRVLRPLGVPFKRLAQRAAPVLRVRGKPAGQAGAPVRNQAPFGAPGGIPAGGPTTAGGAAGMRRSRTPLVLAMLGVALLGVAALYATGLLRDSAGPLPFSLAGASGTSPFGAPRLAGHGSDYTPPADPSQFLHRDYQWSFRGHSWDFQLDVPASAYQHFHDAQRPSRLDRDGDGLVWSYAYGVMAKNPLDDAYIEGVAAELHRAATEYGYSDDETLSFVLAFVQSLPYTVDSVTTGADEYPRFPLETLVDDGGDCEDTAILYAALVDALGYGVVLLDLPGHVAAGVAGDADLPGSYYDYSGRRYYYAETTGDDWTIGEIPDEYKGAKASILPLEAEPVFNLEVTYGAVRDGRWQAITLSATNAGSASASNVVLTSLLDAGNHKVWDEIRCPKGTVEPGGTVRCSGDLDLGKVPRGTSTQILSQVEDATFYYSREVSAPWVPRA